MFEKEIRAAYENGKIELDTMGQLASENFSLRSLLKAVERGWMDVDTTEEIISAVIGK